MVQHIEGKTRHSDEIISDIISPRVQSKVLESKAKQVHFQQDLKSSNLTVETWLLARKSLAGSEW